MFERKIIAGKLRLCLLILVCFCSLGIADMKDFIPERGMHSTVSGAN